jgi:hypothetical protein
MYDGHQQDDDSQHFGLITYFLHTVATACGPGMPVSAEQHLRFTPQEMLSKLSNDSERYGVNSFDVYGDFGSSDDDSFICKMEER